MAIDKQKILARRAATRTKTLRAKDQGKYDTIWPDVLEIIGIVKEQGDASFTTTEVGIDLRESGYQVNQATYKAIEACCDTCGFRRTPRSFPKTYLMPDRLPTLAKGAVVLRAYYKPEAVTLEDLDDLDDAKAPATVPTPPEAPKALPEPEKATDDDPELRALLDEANYRSPEDIEHNKLLADLHRKQEEQS